MKLKNLPDVHSILLGAEENDFQLSIHKERRVKLRVTFETFRGKNQHLLGNLIFEKWPKCASAECTRQISGNQNIPFILIFYRN